MIITSATVIFAERAFKKRRRNSCSVQHVFDGARPCSTSAANGISRIRARGVNEMRVHDDADSKYNVMGKSSKMALKRPNTVVFREKSNKVQKINENNQCNNSVNTTKNNDKLNVSLHQRRKSLPVYMHRKR